MSNYYFIKNKLNGNVIDIQAASTAAGPLLDAYPQKSSGNNNQLWEFVPDSLNSGYYFIKSKLDGNVVDIQGASLNDGAGLDAYPQKSGASQTLNQLWQFVQDPAGSGYFFIMSKLNGNVIDVRGASTTAGTLLNAYPMKSSGTDNQLWQVVGGSFPKIFSTVQDTSLGSNQNYIFYSQCKDLYGVAVTIEITEDIVCKSVAPPPAAACNGSGGTIGFSFQLNCYSPKNFLSAWQQYVITFWQNASGGYDVRWGVDNWPVSGPNIINNGFPIFSTLRNAVLPAGYKLQIGWENTGNNVTGASFAIYDNKGALLGNVNQTLTQLPGVTSSDIAPITAFELNLVGPINGESAVLSSGAGFISYTAASPNLAPVVAEPSCTESGYITCETANSFYGPLPSNPNLAFKQPFWVSSAQPMIFRKGARARPSTRIPDEKIREMLGFKPKV
jgi:hypothetical protein